MKWMRAAESTSPSEHSLSQRRSAAAAQTGTARITGTVTDRTAGAPDRQRHRDRRRHARRAAAPGPTGGSRSPTCRPARSASARRASATRRPTSSSTLTAGQVATVNIAMAAASVTLDQMVVVGYGTQQRSDLTGSVASVTPNVEQTPVLSLEQTLQGAAPGVMVTQASSAPGGALSIRVRGGASVTGNNEPLYVIDGFPIENDPDNQSPSDGGRDATTTVPSNPMAALNPNDIESIEILKDASATSIYGARGANGVIIITTKHGTTTRPKFTLDSYTGTQSIAHRYDLLNGTQFAQFANAWSAGQRHRRHLRRSVVRDEHRLAVADLPRRADPQRAGRRHRRGRRDERDALRDLRRRLSAGRHRRQLRLQAHLDARQSRSGRRRSNLRLSSNITLSRALSNSIPTDGSLNAGAGAVGAAIDYYPVLPVRQANGVYTLMSLNSPSSVLQAQSNLANPVSMANDVTDKLTDTRVLANASGEYDVLSGLKLRVNVGTDLSNRGRDTYYPRTTLMGSQVNGQAVRGTTQTTNFLNENTLSYNHSLGAANALDAVVGYTPAAERSDEQHDQEQQLRQRHRRLRVDRLGHADRRSERVVRATRAGRSRRTSDASITRSSIATSSRSPARRDGSSRFGADHQWGVFPSAAFGWRVTDEPFMARFPAIELLKFRVSTGTAGNPSIRPYQSMAHLLLAAVHVRQHGRPGLLSGVGRQPEPRLGIDAADRLRRGSRSVGRPGEPHGRHL